MSAADAAGLDKAIAHAVAELLAAATEPGAASAAWESARDAAQLLAFEGLDHALAACSAHAGSAMPADVTALVGRLARLADAVREAADVAPIRAADAELNALADELNGYEWTAPEEAAAERRAAVVALEVADVLDDVALAGDESRAVAGRSRLPIPVAAAVRAAIDWLTHPGAPAVVRLFGEPSLLELRLERIRTDRLYPAHRVIAAAGGNLGPAIDGPGWVVRVPSFAERPTYLMLVQGGVRIAVPWHAVLKLRIVPTHRGSGGKGSMEYAVVPPIGPPASDLPEHPVVLIGHGLKRGYLIADRLIWRMTAEPWESEWGSPGGGLRDTVRTQDGEVFWVADPARLLADVELPHIMVDPASVAPEPRVLGASDVQPLGTTVVAPQPAPEPAEVIAAPALESVETAPPEAGPAVPALDAVETAPHPAGPAVPALDAVETAPPPASAPAPALEVVETAPPPASPAVPALEAVEAVSPPAGPAAPAPEAPAAVATPAPGAPPTARALIADDSLTMRLLLARLLEHHGFTVETVSSAAELTKKLHDAAWTVLFTDLELPDGGGPDWLRQVCQAAASRPHPVRVVALVRDGGDLDVARSVGIQDTLLKPFARESLAAMLARHRWNKT